MAGKWYSFRKTLAESALPASALSGLESGFVWRCAANASKAVLTSPPKFEMTCHKIRCSTGRGEKPVSAVKEGAPSLVEETRGDGGRGGGGGGVGA